MNVKIEHTSVVYMKVDAIVNAANSQLIRGGGVCGAIFAKSKDPDKMQSDCYRQAPCKPGNSAITSSYGLNAPYVIHTVGPIYHGDSESAPILASAYRSALELADEKGLKSIAFPSLSTGIFGYPIEKAALIALNTIHDFKPKHLEECVICLFQYGEYSAFKNAYMISKYQEDL